MKKRTLVCFLIFTLCVFYTAIPNTVFGQEDPVALAKQIFDEHSETLQREDVKAELPGLLANLQAQGDEVNIPQVIDLAILLVNNSGPEGLQEAAALQGFPLTDNQAALFADADVQALLTAETTKKLLGLERAELQAGLEELLRLANEPLSDDTDGDTGDDDTGDGTGDDDTGDGTGDDDTGDGTGDDDTGDGTGDDDTDDETTTMPVASLAQQVFDKYSETLQRDDVKAQLPGILANLQGAGDEVDIPALIGLAIVIVNSGGPAALQEAAAAQGVTLTDDQAALFADADVQTLLTDETTQKLLGLKGAELQAGLAELLRLANEPVSDDTGDGTGDDDTGDGTGDDDTGDETDEDDTGDETGEIQPPVEIPIVPPAEPITPTNLTGKSQLGGLSLNPINGRFFVDEIDAVAKSLGFSIDPILIADFLAGFVPQGFFPRNEIRDALLTQRFPIFQQEADHLDPENFGNAITPNFADFAFSDYWTERRTPKYLTSDSLHLYVRVPAKLGEDGGVNFNLTDKSGNVQTYEATEVTGEFQANTIPYTFRLEETLAAAHLPAWADLEGGQLFDSVTLLWSDRHDTGYQSRDMEPVPGTNGGVVWEFELGLPPDRGSTFYYFEVVLAKPLRFTTLDRDKIDELLKDPTVTLAQVFAEENIHQREITGWSMPDPRNLQLVDRGIIDEMLTADLLVAFSKVLASPEAAPVIEKFDAGESLSTSEIQKLVSPELRRDIQRILGRKVESLISEFDEKRDPMIASVLSVPKLKDGESLWVTRISGLDPDPQNPYNLEAIVHDAGNELDQIQEHLIVDTKAPEARVNIAVGENTTGYQNGEVFIATASDAGAAMLNITANPTDPSEIGLDKGYLFYQMVGLDANEDGTFSFYADEASSDRPNTWMPLSVQSTMLTSRIWNEIQKAVNEGRLDLPQALDNPNVRTALGLGIKVEEITDLLDGKIPERLKGILAVLNIDETNINDLLLSEANKIFASWEDFTGFSEINETQYQFIVDVLGATVDIIDYLVPLTYDATKSVMMPIQGGKLPLLSGDYGIRAMGIDTLLNVGAYAEPTYLRIVDSSDPAHQDRASVTFAVIGDCNMDGDMDDRFERGPVGDVTIFGNTTENVMLTVTVDHRSVHPVDIKVEYMDANGGWREIGTKSLAANEVMPTFDMSWNVDDFDALVAAGDSVKVRAVAINALGLKDPDPVEGEIGLDEGICPLDPDVIAIRMDPATTTNSVSGAPQGMLTLNAYTPSRTSTEIDSVRLVAKGPQDAEWSIDTSEVVDDIGGQQLADLLGDLVSTVGPDKPIVNVDSTYRKWSVTIDTTDLADTITAGKDENQYVVTGSAYDANGTELLPPIDGVEEKFSVDNIDITNITAVADADGAVEANEDGSYSVGGLVDKYDDTVESPMVTFTIKPVSYHGSYTSVMLVTDAEGVSIGEASETAEGSGVFEITVNVGILADGEYLNNGTYMFHAVVVDAEGSEVSETDGAKISVNVENTRRPEPEILAITTDPAAETNPDSGAPKGTVTVNAYSIGEITSPRITSMRFEINRRETIDDDSAWKEVGTTEEGTAVTSEEVQELQQLNVDALTDLITVAAGTAAGSSDPSPIHRYQAYQKWTVDIDTVAMELPDTIDKDSPAARDVSKDDNPYIVRAIAFSKANEKDTPAPDGVNSTFSLDNFDDVAPGIADREGDDGTPAGPRPTNIVAVADILADGTEANIEANEDGSYPVGGIVDPSVEQPPVAIFTIKPTSERITYDSVKLVTDAEGITIGEAVEVEDGVFKIETDVSEVPNGTYMFNALAFDASGHVQEDMSETDGSRITVGVTNFRVADVTDLAVIAVDGTDVAEAPAEPIPLRGSVTVSFMVANGSLAAEELSGAVDGSDVPSESAEDPENTFSLKVEVGALVDGVYTPDGVVTKRNGSVDFPITTVNVDNTGPMVTIESPTEDETVESLPTIRATYHDGAGAGVDGATGSLALARLQPPDEAEIVVDQADLDKDAASLVYTRSEPLAGGAYRVTVQVADNLGNVGEGSAEFAVNGTAPMVVIHSPASGQTFEHGEPLISGEFSGAGTVKVTTFTINDVAATPEEDGNRFSYTPEEGLGDGNHTVVVAVTDGDGNTAQTSVTFTVEMPKDTTPPIISAAAPNGIIKDPDVDKAGSAKISAVVTDEQSAVSSVKYSINGGQLRSIAKSNIVGGKIEAPIDFAAHGPGLYNVRLVATSEGGTTEYTWSFTIVVDNVKPVITSITPSGTIRGGLPVISASANDESGVSKMTITVWDSAGKEVKGKAANDSGKDVEGITRVDFNLEAPLEEGLYTIEVRATDPYDNSTSAKGNFTIDFDTAAPVITMASPQNEARLTNRRPLISIAYADAESGVDVDSIRFIFNSNVINLKPNQKTASQVLYRPEADLPFGQHTVKLEVSDMAHKEGNVAAKNKGAREANMAAYEFTFFVESVEGPILVARPINVPNPFKDETHISFALTRQSVVSIAIYDSTLRPVRVLMDNKVMDAGNYFGKDGGILWNGKSSGDEEDLARGIYFCQIIVGDGIEPEYAILKLALTR